MDSLNIIVNIITGGLVGYITNSLAIQMLFKEYPIIGGGEVIKDRKNLEDAMSELVEERLITPETVLREFNKDAFKQSFEQLILHIIEHQLQANLKKYNTLGELEGYHTSSQNLKQYLLTHKDDIMGTLLDTLTAHIHLNDLMSPAQQAHLLPLLFHACVDLIVEKLPELMDLLKSEFNEQTLDETLDISALKSAAKGLTKDLHLRLKILLKPHEDAIFEHLETTLDIETLGVGLVQNVSQYSLKELLGKNTTEASIRDLLEKLITYLSSPKGETLLIELLEHLIAFLKTIHLPLGTFITPELEAILAALVGQYLPGILNRFEHWVDANRDELEAMILSAIDEHLRTENLVKHLTATIFSEQLSQKYKIIRTLLEEIKVLAEQSMEDLIRLLMRFLEHTSLGELVVLLEEKNLLDARAINRVLLKGAQHYLPQLNLSQLETPFETPLNQFLPLSDTLLRQLYQKVFRGVLQKSVFTQFLYHPQTDHMIQSLIEELIDKGKDTPFDHWIPVQAEQNLQQLLADFLTAKPIRDFALNKIARVIPELLHDRKLKDVMTQRIQSTIWRKLSAFYNQQVTLFLEHFQSERIDQLYRRFTEIYINLSHHEVFARKTRNILVGYMIQLIRQNRLFDQRIKVVVKESFVRFSDEEMQAEMEDFMGAELQPIAYLGAFLGALVGMLLSLTEMIPGVATYTSGFAALLSYPLAFALTGIGTNWLAIQMLFYPYQALNIPLLGWQIPFTPGVFVKNRETLGESMAKFIDQKLLSKDNMVEILERYHPQWKRVIKDVVSQDNYEVFDQKIKAYAYENYDSLSPIISELGFEQINQNQQKIASYFIQQNTHMKVEPQDISQLSTELFEQITLSQPQLLQFIKGQLESYAHSPQTLETLLPTRTHEHLKAWLGTLLEQGLNAVNDTLKTPQALESRLKLLIQFLGPYYSLELDKLPPLKELPIVEVIMAVLKELNYDTLEKWVTESLLQYGHKAFRKDMALGQVYEGKLLEMIQAQTPFLVEIGLVYLTELAQSKRQRLVNALLKDIQKQGVVELMMISFGGVKRDLGAIVDVVVEEKLPVYLESKEGELNSLIFKVLEQNIAHMTLNELGLERALLQTENLIHWGFQDFLRHPELAPTFDTFASNVFHGVLEHVSLKDILQGLEAENPDLLLHRFQRELHFTQQHLATRLETHSVDLHATLHPLLNQFVLETAPAQLLTPDFLMALKHALHQLSDTLFDSEVIPQLKALFDSGLQHRFGHQTLGDIVNLDILQDDFSALLDQLTSRTPQTSRNQPFQEDLLKTLKPLTLDFIEVLNDTLVQETKVDLENIIVDSLIDGLRVNNREVLEPIDFEGIVKDEVNNMDAARIKSLFDFAQPIFRALIIYGALGGVMGVVAGLLAFFS